MDIRDQYTLWAESYDQDRNLTRDLDAGVTRDTLAEARVANLLELGCGTGKNTAFFATLADEVLALDFSEGMIAQARAKITDPRVTFNVADLNQPWPAAPASMDLVCSNLVLEHIADLGAIFAEAARVLRPGGCYFLAELHPYRQYQGARANFEREGAQIEIPAYVHHISDVLKAAQAAGFALDHLREWWHPEDRQAPPRLLSALFRLPTPAPGAP